MKSLSIKTQVTLLALIFISTTLFANQLLPGSKTKWIKYTSVEEKVTIKFPGEPEVVDEMRENGQHHVRAQYQVGEHGMYMLDIVHHTTDLSETEDLDQISLESFVESIHQTEYTQEDFYVKKNKGIRAMIHMEEQGVTIEYRILIAGQRQIQVIVMMPEEEWDQESVDKFYDSWKLLK